MDAQHDPPLINTTKSQPSLDINPSFSSSTRSTTVDRCLQRRLLWPRPTMLPTDKCDNGCTAPSISVYQRAIRSQPLSVVALSSLPFLLTFVIVSIAVLYKLFPLLVATQQHKPGAEDHYLPSDAPSSLRSSHNEHGSKTKSAVRWNMAAVVLSSTIALSTVLAELILCEISDLLNPAARTAALKVTIPTILFMLIVLIPFLELQSVVRGFIGREFGKAGKAGKGRIPKLPWLLQILGFAAWITVFWSIGEWLPEAHVRNISSGQSLKNLSDACLERVGIIGISLMALLSGFASVSSPWQSFGARPKPVTDTDISRKQVGLDATNDMLGLKRSRLRALQRKMSEAPQDGFMTKVIGTIRGNVDVQELKTLQLETSGLEAMSMSLSSQLTMLQSRHVAARRMATPLGKAMIIPSYGFSIYCLYRILATTYTTLRRYSSPTATFSTSDPINRFLGLLAKHWDPTLDQAAWSQQISFLLSGVILLASFNSVFQTFHLFTRFTPGLLFHAQANLALIVGQVSATYVISSALLLRSNLPREVGSVISEALGSPLDSFFVDRWFEGWFLVGGAATALGIWLGRRLGKGDVGEDWDDYDVEMGTKRS